VKRLLAAAWGWVAFWHRPVFDVETWPIVPSPPCLAEGEELSDVALREFRAARINDDEEQAAAAMRDRSRNAAYSPSTTDLRVQIERLQAKLAAAHFAELAEEVRHAREGITLDSVIQEIRGRLFEALTSSQYAWPPDTSTVSLISALRGDRDSWQNIAEAGARAMEGSIKTANDLRREAADVRACLIAASADPDATDASTGLLANALSAEVRTLRESCATLRKTPRRRTKKT
jgi:hypothetical protein